GPFPTVAHIRVPVDEHHRPPGVVQDGAKVRNETALLPSAALHERSDARHLRIAVDLVKATENWMILRHFDDLAIRENAFQFTREVFPLDRSMKVVEHRRSATEQELAESRDLGVEHPQETRLDKIDPRIFEEALVIERQDDGIFDLNRGCRLYPPRQVLFRSGTVDKPRFAG